MKWINYSLFISLFLNSCFQTHYSAGNIENLASFQSNVREEIIFSFTDSIHKRNLLKVPDSLTIANKIVVSKHIEYRLFYLENPKEVYLMSFDSGDNLLRHYTFKENRWIRGGDIVYSKKEKERIEKRYKKEILSEIVKEARIHAVPDSLIFVNGDTIVR